MSKLPVRDIQQQSAFLSHVVMPSVLVGATLIVGVLGLVAVVVTENFQSSWRDRETRNDLVQHMSRSSATLAASGDNLASGRIDLAGLQTRQGTINTLVEGTYAASRAEWIIESESVNAQLVASYGREDEISRSWIEYAEKGRAFLILSVYPSDELRMASSESLRSYVGEHAECMPEGEDFLTPADYAVLATSDSREELPAPYGKLREFMLCRAGEISQQVLRLSTDTAPFWMR